MTTPDFAVLPNVRAMFADAAARGAADARSWMTQHPTATQDEFAAFVLSSLTAPDAATIDADMAIAQSATRTRDAAHDAQAVWLDGNGVFDAWNGALDQLDATLPAAQAKAGRDLLEQAQGLALDISDAGKSQFQRLRPAAEHPDQFQLPDGVTRATGFSLPSGHGAHSFATAAVLGALDPSQAASTAALAEQISYSRVYATAHYASDLAAGAYIGAAVGAYFTDPR